ncbi:TIGR02757 family protein [Bacteroides congonensis]|jgi:uncharacterized protein (TIGR02757 family)|uniref:TIGR02757 family protein n=1 Tax=Bacteroides congonensis TaxID=1871006 RepID=UPI00321AEF7C
MILKYCQDIIANIKYVHIKTVAMTPSLKNEMDQIWNRFDCRKFILNDPIQVVHSINIPGKSIADIEICAILTAMVSWGQRNHIIYCADTLMSVCEWEPYNYIKFGVFYDIPDECCIYRTLKGKAFKEVCHQLRCFYSQYNSIQEYINKHSISLDDLLITLCNWYEPARLGNPYRNSACKRINMLLRWMVRKDEVDLGLWQTDFIKPNKLYAIMDTHVAQQAQRMGIISYPKESWKAVMELTHVYRQWDAEDPLKYDFILMTKNLK